MISTTWKECLDNGKKFFLQDIVVPILGIQKQQQVLSLAVAFLYINQDSIRWILNGMLILPLNDQLLWVPAVCNASSIWGSETCQSKPDGMRKFMQVWLQPSSI